MLAPGDSGCGLKVIIAGSGTPFAYRACVTGQSMLITRVIYLDLGILTLSVPNNAYLGDTLGTVAPGDSVEGYYKCSNRTHTPARQVGPVRETRCRQVRRRRIIRHTIVIIESDPCWQCRPVRPVIRAGYSDGTSMAGGASAAGGARSAATTAASRPGASPARIAGSMTAVACRDRTSASR